MTSVSYKNVKKWRMNYNKYDISKNVIRVIYPYIYLGNGWYIQWTVLVRLSWVAIAGLIKCQHFVCWAYISLVKM